MNLDEVKWLLANVRGPLVRSDPAGGHSSTSYGHWGRSRLIGVKGDLAIIQPMGHKKHEYVDPKWLSNWKSKNGEIEMAKKKYDYEEAEKLKKMGKSNKDITAITGIPQSSLSQYLTDRGLRTYPKRVVTVFKPAEPVSFQAVVEEELKWDAAAAQVAKRTELLKEIDREPVVLPRVVAQVMDKPRPTLVDLRVAIRAIMDLPIPDTSKLLAIEALVMN